MTCTIKPGDILYTSWGCEQTNVEFYQVLRTTAQTVWLAEIDSCKESRGDMVAQVRPKPGIFRGDVFYRRIGTSWNGEPLVRIDSCTNGRLWEGGSKRASSYA